MMADDSHAPKPQGGDAPGISPFATPSSLSAPDGFAFHGEIVSADAARSGRYPICISIAGEEHLCSLEDARRLAMELQLAMAAGAHPDWRPRRP